MGNESTVSCVFVSSRSDRRVAGTVGRAAAFKAAEIHEGSKCFSTITGERIAAGDADTAQDTLAAETLPTVPRLSPSVARTARNVYRNIFLSVLLCLTRQARRLPTAIIYNKKICDIVLFEKRINVPER